MAKAAPLLCAGITTYSPLRHFKINSNHKVGIAGLGAWSYGFKICFLIWC